MKKRILRGSLSSLVIVFLLLAGCKSANPTSEVLTQTEANAIAMNVTQSALMAIADGLSHSFSNVNANSPVRSAAIPQGIKSPALTYISIDFTSACAGGGYIHVVGSLSGNIDNNGSGMLLIGITETVLDYRCPEGFVVNGDPYISLAGTFSFLNGSPATTQTMSMGGGIKWTRSGSTTIGNCQIQLTINFPTATSSGGSISGTMCGVQIHESF